MADELLTVAEAAARLGISIPRLRRWLLRSENASYSFPMQRQTVTGTRKAIVISVATLPQIQREIEQERERKMLKTTVSDKNDSMVHIEALLHEKDARIAELTAALEHERERNRRPFWLRWLGHF